MPTIITVHMMNTKLKSAMLHDRKAGAATMLTSAMPMPLMSPAAPCMPIMLICAARHSV